jgi:hypothetical protein
LTTATQIQTDLTQALTDAAAVRAEIQTRATTEENFDVQAAQLSILNAKIRELTISANEGERINVSTTLCQEFATSIEASDLERLIGEPIVAVYLTKTKGTGENDDFWSIIVNPKARVATTKSATKTSGGSRKTPQFRVDGNEPMTAFDFSVAYATAEDQEHSLWKLNDAGKRKWPTQPDFLDHAEAELIAAGHTVERIDPS